MLRGVYEQRAKAEQAVAGTPGKAVRFIQLDGGTRSVNRDLEDNARPWPGSSATSRTWPPAGRHARDRGVRDQCLPPALRDLGGVEESDARFQCAPDDRVCHLIGALLAVPPLGGPELPGSESDPGNHLGVSMSR